MEFHCMFVRFTIHRIYIRWGMLFYLKNIVFDNAAGLQFFLSTDGVTSATGVFFLTTTLASNNIVGTHDDGHHKRCPSLPHATNIDATNKCRLWQPFEWISLPPAPISTVKVHRHCYHKHCCENFKHCYKQKHWPYFLVNVIIDGEILLNRSVDKNIFN